jgi:hypothetical protein
MQVKVVNWSLVVVIQNTTVVTSAISQSQRRDTGNSRWMGKLLLVTDQ